MSDDRKKVLLHWAVVFGFLSGVVFVPFTPDVILIQLFFLATDDENKLGCFFPWHTVSL